MKKILIILLFIFYVLPGFAQVTVTHTATRFNDYGGVYVNNFFQSDPQQVAFDDDIYAKTKKLSSKNGYAELRLQGFEFNIPTGATIESISVRVLRFKKGRPNIKDYIAHLRRPQAGSVSSEPYGYQWGFSPNYPETETEYYYNQNGSGNDGGYNHTTAYQWTADMINDRNFGILIQVATPEGAGSVVVYYDQVTISITYTEAVTIRQAPVTPETKLPRAPVVYPNPFRSKASLQFTAAEDGNAVVDLYTIWGVKIQVLFSGKVFKGQVYQVTVGDGLLPKGVYLYVISNGKQKYTGRIIKLE